MKTGAAGRRKCGVSQIDWQRVRQHLESAAEAIQRGWAPEPEERQRILIERARLLAQAPTVVAEEERLEAVLFVMATEIYAIESRYVREVYPLQQLTPLPCTPEFVLGIVNVRSEMLSVVDIGKFFDLPRQGLSNLDRIIVLDSGEMSFGILADAVTGVRDITLAELQPPLPTLTGIRQEYLRGVTPERIILLDAGKMMADENIIVCEQP